MIYLHKVYDCSKKTRWGREVKVVVVRLRCKVVGTYDKDEIFIRLGKSKHFPFQGGITIRVLKNDVIKG